LILSIKLYKFIMTYAPVAPRHPLYLEGELFFNSPPSSGEGNPPRQGRRYAPLLRGGA